MQQNYAIVARAPLARCSAVPLYTYLRVHDALAEKRAQSGENWEDFNEDAVPAYIENAMPHIYANLERLEDLNEPYLPSQASELLFMIEAVIEARSLIG